jgi:hypothetical protein
MGIKGGDSFEPGGGIILTPLTATEDERTIGRIDHMHGARIIRSRREMQNQVR